MKRISWIEYLFLKERNGQEMSRNISKNELVVEILNALTHGVGALLGIVGLYFLLMKLNVSSGLNVSELTSYLIYGLSIIVLFLASTLYHSFSFTRFKSLFQKIDHAAIYLLIAGTYTPYLIITVGGKLGYGFLALVWLAAIAGIIFKVFWIDRFPKLSTFLYLGMGWMAIFLIYPLYQSLDVNGLVLLLVGGIFYSVGAYFYQKKHLNWMHVIWHLFVIAGAAFMFFSVFLYV